MRRSWNAPAIRAVKTAERSEPLVMVTAYDAPGARTAHAAGVDLILVGDSVAMVVLGYDDTLSVTVDDIAHHTGAVARGLKSSTAESRLPMVVADLPWMSYHTDPHDAVRNAATLLRRRVADIIHPTAAARLIGLWAPRGRRLAPLTGLQLGDPALQAVQDVVDLIHPIPP